MLTDESHTEGGVLMGKQSRDIATNHEHALRVRPNPNSGRTSNKSRLTPECSEAAEIGIKFEVVPQHSIAR